MSDTDLLRQHDVAFGDEIPAAGEVEGREEREEGEMDAGDTVNVHGGPNPQLEGIEEMKKRLKEIEDEAVALRRMQAQVEKEMAAAAAVEDPASVFATQAAKEEADSRSIYVGNVDYACTPEEVQQHFQSCGTVNRVTILTDKFGQPKGFAYVEFVEIDAVQNALLLNESELHGRLLKVSAKRTNVPGMKQYRARRSNPYMAMAYSPPPFNSPYRFGKAPRFRRPMRFRPYY